MQLHQIKIIKARKKTRIGRGGKRGTYSGRGIKGQKARAGHRIKPAIRELIIRIPKLRGVKNKSIFPKTIAINIGELFKKTKETTITKESLVNLGFIRNKKVPVKILANGEIGKSLTVKGIKVSAKAKEKIEAAGGKVE